MKLFKSQSDNSQLVEQIHQEFNLASDNLLAEARQIIQDAPEKQILKGQRLARLGFTNTREAAMSQEQKAKMDDVNEQVNIILYYKQEYPDNKFITDELVNRICQKYNLVMGPISRYKGFVPEKNLQEIENFKGLKDGDEIATTHRISSITFTCAGIDGDGIKDIKEHLKESNNLVNSNNVAEVTEYLSRTIGKRGSHRHTSIGNIKIKTVAPEKFLICAPKSDMDTVGLKQVGFKLMEIFSTKIVEVPDPIVLTPVKDGYLIVTMWGDEKNDPELND